MPERFHNQQPDYLSKEEKHVLQEAMRKRGGIHMAEGFVKKEIRPTNPPQTIISERYKQTLGPQKLRRIFSTRIQKSSGDHNHTQPLTSLQIGKIAGITVICAGGAIALTEAVGLVFVGTTLPVVLPWMAGAGILGGLIGFNEAVKEIRSKKKS